MATTHETGMSKTRREPPSEHASLASRATTAVEEVAERSGDWVWDRLRKRPYLGVAVASGVGLTIASLIGVGEMAFGVLAGYVSYKMLVKHEPPSQALRDAAKLRQEFHA